ncbi:MAG: 5-(carboxyamino)imidazole ribonucleotide mutase [Verrucomicrobia bacterium]|nr:5-(carboxyamino)imidazole ribonucleotide mutase [Verrucomicrobiota bacterium]
MNAARSTSTPQVSLVMGSTSDMPTVQKALDALKEFHVEYEVKVLSAHRTPEKTAEFAREARGRGIRVLIGAAGGAAHLAGALAAHSTLPVIGIPIPSPHLGGLDSLLSTVQMPAGVPVATVAIGDAGAKNAALLAIEILALSDPALLKRLNNYRADLAERVEKDGRDVRNE